MKMIRLKICRTMRMLPIAVLMVMGLCTARAFATNITFVVAAYSQHTGPFFVAAAKDYEALHPDVHINVEVISWENLFQRLTTDIAGGTPPDMSIIGTRWLYDFATQGIAEPLNSYMTPEFQSTFIKTFFAPSTVKGQIMGLPVAASVRAMMVNLDVLKMAGAKPPTTWAELHDAAKKVAAMKGYFGFALQGAGVETDAYYYYALWSFGGNIFTPDGQSGLDQPQAIAAASFYRQMIDEHLTQPTPTSYNQTDTFNLFKQGHVGIVFTYPMLIPQVKQEDPGMHYAVLPIPRDATQATYGVTDTLMLFHSSKVKQAAWKFIEFLYQDKYREKFDEQEGFLPVTNDVAALPYYQNNPDMKAFAAGLPYAKFAPLVANWEQMADTIVTNMQRIYLRESTPQQGMTTTTKQIDQIISQQ